MLGPVWSQITLQGARRWWLHLLRYGYALCQVLGFLMLFNPFGKLIDGLNGNGNFDIRPDLPYASVLFVRIWLWQQFGITVVLSVPFVAGEITEEKQRGTLALLLTTPLEVGPLLAGKLLGRGSQLLTVLLTGLPLFCFAAVWAGVTPGQILAQVVTVVLWVFALGALGLLTSVWCRSTRAAMFGLYGVVAATVALLLTAQWGLGGWLRLAGPRDYGVQVLLTGVNGLLGLLDPLALVGDSAGAWEPRWFATVLLFGGLGSVALLVAAWRLRPVYLGQLAQLDQPQGRWFPRPPMTDEPVYWRERYVVGLTVVLGAQRLPRWLPLMVLALVLTAIAQVVFTLPPPLWGLGMPMFPTGSPWWLKGERGIYPVAVAMAASLVMAVRSATAVATERVHGTWELLLLTPLSEQELVMQKFRGLTRSALPLLAALIGPGVAVALWLQDWEWLVVVGVGLPMVTWAAMRFAVQGGLFQSCYRRSWWQSLGFGIAHGFAISPIFCFFPYGCWMFSMYCIGGGFGMVRDWVVLGCVLVSFSPVAFGKGYWLDQAVAALVQQGRIRKDRPYRGPPGYRR